MLHIVLMNLIWFKNSIKFYFRLLMVTYTCPTWTDITNKCIYQLGMKSGAMQRNCTLPSSVVTSTSHYCHHHAAHCVIEFDLVQNNTIATSYSNPTSWKLFYIKIRLYGWSICKIVNSLVSKFAFVLWLWSQREVSKTNWCKIVHY